MHRQPITSVVIAVSASFAAQASCAAPAEAQAQVTPMPAAPSPWWKAYLAGSQAVSLPDGRKLNLYCEGKGGPTVIMESGLGSAAWTWHNVQDQIAATTRVCVYDRAGYFARSTPGKGLRTAGAEADDLSAMLQAARIKAPYVLVGHSYGGYIVRLFAYRHPDRVAGLVMVDPSSEYQNKLDENEPAAMKASEAASDAKLRRCATEPRPAGDECVLRSSPQDLPADLKPWFVQAQDAAYARAMASEMDAMNTTSSAQLVAEKRSLGSTPVIVLEQTVAAPADAPAEEQAYAAAFLPAWHSLHQQTLSGISTRFALRPVPGAGHRIQDAKPDAVIDAVREVVSAARRR